MSVKTEIERLEGAKNALAASIEGKGVAVPTGTKIDEMAALVDQIQGGGGEDFYIDDASYLFYCGARKKQIDAILPMLKDVKTIGYMFSGGSGHFKNQIDLSGVDLTKVTNMDRAFSDCQMITGVIFGPHGIIKPENMSYMFANCYSMETVDLSTFDASNCQYLRGLFSNCKSLKNIDLSGLLMEAKISCQADAMLQNCTSLKSVDMSNFDTSRMYNMNNFLDSSRAVEEIVGFSSAGVQGASKLFPCGGGPSLMSKLERLTFRTDLPDGKYAIRSPIDIRYCSFIRDGMVEMFSTLPDISGLTLNDGYKRITITGNPCATDGTLTDEDKAIAIGKGWTIVI